MGFCGKKRKNCDRTQAADNDKGDQWDHTAIDAETRLLIGVVPGRRTMKSCVTLVQAVKDKTNDRTDMFFTTDEHSPYKMAIDKVYQKMTYFRLYSYNFCWRVRTLTVQSGSKKRKQTPAMAAGLTDHIWSIEEWVTYPMLLHSQ